MQDPIHTDISVILMFGSPSVEKYVTIITSPYENRVGMKGDRLCNGRYEGKHE